MADQESTGAALAEIPLSNTTPAYAPLAEYQVFPAHESLIAPIPQSQYFKLFSYLSEDLKATVLSFVADAPFETVTLPQNYPKSNLTHSLPAVNRHFRSLCNGNLFWKEAVIRMTKQEPDLWTKALRALLRNNNSNHHYRHKVHHVDVGAAAQPPNEETVQQLVEDAHQAWRKRQPVKSSDKSSYKVSYKAFYETIVNRHLRFKGPLFFMPGQVALGQEYSLHFFEPRYRLLMAQIMRHQPAAARNGGPIRDAVYFLHANRAPLERTTPAVLVQVRQCQIYSDGRADVVLLPVHYVWLERIWVRSDQGNLYYAQVLKMGRDVTQLMNNLQRQEALANVMDRLAGELAEETEDSSGGEEDWNSSDNSSSNSESE